MRRPQKKEVHIDVVPYLDSMVIVLNLICLIIIIMIIPIALNPKQVNILSFEKLFRPAAIRHEKSPTYLDCRPDGVTILPGDIVVEPAALRQAGNPIERVIAKAERNRDGEYIILLIRPNSLPVYRFVRKMVGRRDVDIGFDVIDTGTKLDWREAMKELNITYEEETF